MQTGLFFYHRRCFWDDHFALHVFWQSSQVVEEETRRDEAKPPSGLRLKKHISVMRLDNAIGMVVSEITTWCILLVSASTLNVAGITHIASAADAARALEPLVDFCGNTDRRHFRRQVRSSF
ncbi:divalent metal cation transporter [Pedobacter sp. JY14-1]|uniref:divalent metal cation transporter n=1 Tax=Pedobacter sp. JY14-1 TaxID=3034151 RepID=UPI0023E0DA51|nr:divalent metal cation transporter [Pedobacter sp. JY14-1]